MNRSFSLTQKVNFYVSIAFIFMFGLFMTTTVVNAINRDSQDLKYLSISGQMHEIGE